jgi:hypothetical protein
MAFIHEEKKNKCFFEILMTIFDSINNPNNDAQNI